MVQLLRVSDVKRALQISESHAYQLLSSGAIRTVRVGRSVRVTEEALADYVKSHESRGCSDE